MKIQSLGHSSFLLTSEQGTRIVTDPYGDVGLVFPHVEAEAVTVSHSHYDHANTGAVRAPLVLMREGSYRVGDVLVTAVSSYHDDQKGKKRGGNLIFSFEADGVVVRHLGDLGEPCCEETVRRIGKTDVLLLPVGGNYTIDAAEAERYVRAIAPAYAIPMHYHVPHLTVDIEGVEPFLRRFSAVERAEALSLGGSVPKGETKIIVLERVK